MNIETIETKLRYSLWGIAAIGIIAVAAYFAWFGWRLGLPWSHGTGTWGEFGDFIGGVMNPLVAACALYWLTMSVRLQKQELAAARDELALTRRELASASTAQQEQARIALIGTRIHSVTVRLNAVSTQLASVHERINYVLQRMDERGPSTSIYENSGGHAASAIDVLGRLEYKAKRLSTMQDALGEELSIIRMEVSAASEKPDAEPPGQT